MENRLKATIFGRDHEEKGDIYCQSLDAFNAALGTSAGITSKPNEDAAGVSAFGPETILAIADGHWGREASEIAVSKAMEQLGQEFSSWPESETRAQLFSLFEQVNSRLYEMAATAAGDTTPETTLIVCHVRETESGKYLYWASFGDSFLYLLRGEQLRQINSLQPRWLGYISKLSERADARAILMSFMANETRLVGVAGGLETGREKLESGDLVLLCTDGLTGSDQNPDPSILHGIKEIFRSDLPLGIRVEKVIAFALARGERDNITCIAAGIV